MPQFGFRTGSFRGATAEQAAAELARLGYDAVELCLEAPDVRPEHLDEARSRELRRNLDRLGIDLASVSYHGDNEALADRRANQERAVRVTRWLGASLLVLNAERTTDRDRQWSDLVGHLQRLCRLAEEENVTIAFEPEPLLVVSSSQDMLDLMQAVGSPRLKVNLDVGHAQITDDNPAATIRRLGQNLVHLHLEDIRERVHRHLLFGEGNIDFAAIRQALADVGYQGPYVADLFGLSDPADTAARALTGMRQLFA